VQRSSSAATGSIRPSFYNISLMDIAITRLIFHTSHENATRAA